MRVLQQMRQRELNHEMRNLSAKLTPAERRVKRISKLQEDTSRQVYVAVFRIKDFSDPKHRQFLFFILSEIFFSPLFNSFIFESISHFFISFCFCFYFSRYLCHITCSLNLSVLLLFSNVYLISSFIRHIFILFPWLDSKLMWMPNNIF